MRNVLALIPAVLLVGACASKPPAEEIVSQAEATATTQAAVTATPPQWQLLRQQYTECAKSKAEAGAAGSGTTQKVVSDALRACQDDLDAVRTSFRQYLDEQMVSAHGKRSARLASDRLGRDTEDKVRAYLQRHVEYQRAIAARR